MPSKVWKQNVYCFQVWQTSMIKTSLIKSSLPNITEDPWTDFPRHAARASGLYHTVWWLFLSFESCRLHKAPKPQKSYSSVLPSRALCWWGMCAMPHRNRPCSSLEHQLIPDGCQSSHDLVHAGNCSQKAEWLQDQVLLFSNAITEGLAWSALLDNQKTSADAVHQHVTRDPQRHPPIL